MSSLNSILYKLQTNKEMREAAFEKAVDDLPTVYTPDAAGKAVFLNHLYAPLTAPAAGTADGTPPQMSDNQKRICDLAQAGVEHKDSSSSGLKKAVLAGILALGAYVGVGMIGDIKGDEPHVNRRKWDYQVKNERWMNTHHGQQAPYMKKENEIVEETSDERAAGETGVEGFAALLALGLGAAALYAFSKKN